jgi:hypothetical protein
VCCSLDEYFLSNSEARYNCRILYDCLKTWGYETLSQYKVASSNRAGSGDYQLDSPYVVCVPKTGIVYVADSSDDRIQRWSPGSIIPNVHGIIDVSELNKPSNTRFQVYMLDF